ncbi:MAG TPA: hypothetical protein VGD89_09740 [Flavipsychrobacter sp.]
MFRAVKNWVAKKSKMVVEKVAIGEAKATLVGASLLLAVIIWIFMNMAMLIILFSDDKDFGKGALFFSLVYALVLLIILSFKKKLVRVVKNIYRHMFTVED